VKVYDSETGLYAFVHLPSFAQFILDHYLDEYVNEQIRLSYEMDIPVLKYLRHFTREQLFQQTRQGNIEFLQNLAANRAKPFIAESMERWLANQLSNPGRRHHYDQFCTAGSPEGLYSALHIRTFSGLGHRTGD
jgi:hypothetical protein